MNISTELQKGKAGEHLVCFDLIHKGYNAFLTDAGLPYDIVVDINGRILRIQVKSCSKKCNLGKYVKNVYNFSLRPAKSNSITKSRKFSCKNIDYIAFVFMDIKCVQYIAAKHLCNPITGDLIQCLNFRDPCDNITNDRVLYKIGDFDYLEQ